MKTLVDQDNITQSPGNTLSCGRNLHYALTKQPPTFNILNKILYVNYLYIKQAGA